MPSWPFAIGAMLVLLTGCASGSTLPGSTLPGSTLPGSTLPGSTVPETTVPETTVPETTVPAFTVPVSIEDTVDWQCPLAVKSSSRAYLPHEMGVGDDPGPAEVAAVAGNLEALATALAAGSAPDAFVQDGRSTMLWILTARGCLDGVELLLDHGADPNLRSGIGGPLHEAAGSGFPEIADLLLEYGADVGTVTVEGDTPLHYAENVAVAEVLLRYGADLAAVSDFNDQPMDFALFAGRREVAALLLEAGAPVRWESFYNALDPRGVEVDMVGLLLNGGHRPVSEEGMWNGLPSELARRRGYEREAELLAAAGL